MNPEHLKKKILNWGASLVGFGRVADTLPEYLRGLDNAVSIAVALSWGIVKGIRDGPTPTYYQHYLAVNALLDDIAPRVANLIEDQGLEAVPLPATVDRWPEAGSFSAWSPDRAELRAEFPHKTAATCAGLGWIGKTALFVSYEYGPRVRLTTVLTNMPLPVGEPVYIGQCGPCSACVNACPAGAGSGKEWNVRMKRSDFFDVYKCWEWCTKEEHRDVGDVCGICISVCPKSRPHIKKESFVWRVSPKDHR